MSSPKSKVSMKPEELRELDAWLDINIFGVKKLSSDEMNSAIEKQLQMGSNCGSFSIGSARFRGGIKENGELWSEQHFVRRCDNAFGAMELLKKLHNEFDRQSCLASLHNFLMRKSHDGKLSELQVCLFAKKLFTK